MMGGGGWDEDGEDGGDDDDDDGDNDDGDDDDDFAEAGPNKPIKVRTGTEEADTGSLEAGLLSVSTSVAGIISTGTPL